MEQALKTRPARSSVAAAHITKGVAQASPTTPALKTDDAELKRDISRMFGEVVAMTAALAGLTDILTKDLYLDTFSIHEAMEACVQRMQRAIELVEDRLPQAGWDTP